MLLSMKDPSEKKQTIKATAANAFNALILASPKITDTQKYYWPYIYI